MGCFPCLGMGPPGTSTSNCATNRKRVGSRRVLPAPLAQPTISDSDSNPSPSLGDPPPGSPGSSSLRLRSQVWGWVGGSSGLGLGLPLLLKIHNWQACVCKPSLKRCKRPPNCASDEQTSKSWFSEWNANFSQIVHDIRDASGSSGRVGQLVCWEAGGGSE